MTLLMQNIIVGLIILSALAWIIVKLIRARKKGSVGCSCCSISESCPKNKEAIYQKPPCSHCQKKHESSEICCSVSCPGDKDTVSSKKSNHHENNKNLE